MNTPAASPADTPLEPVPAVLFDEIDAILDEMRTRYDETPQWEFCEGFLAALICCRRSIPQGEYLDVLLAVGEDSAATGGARGAGAGTRRAPPDDWVVVPLP